VREVNFAKARTHFSALLKAVEEGGETILITRNGLAVARLEPLVAADSSQTPSKPSEVDLVRRFQTLRERVAQTNSSTDKPTGKT